jgi:aminoglycoside 6'-N-acetyltransferase
MRREDFPDLTRWLATPHVQQWWREPMPPEKVEADYGPCIDGTEPTLVYVVEEDGRAIGMVQAYYLHSYPDWQHQVADDLAGRTAAGFDYVVGEVDCLHRGLGTAAIGAMLALLPTVLPGSEIAVVAPQKANRPSWRTLERHGFTRIFEGMLASDDPGDTDVAYVYLRPL